MRRLLVSGVVAIAAVAGASYGAFEYWVNWQMSTLPQSIAQGKLTEVTPADVNQIRSLSTLLDRSPLPWHQTQHRQVADLLEVSESAQATFDSQKVSQLKIGHLLTLQRELENYVQRYPDHPYTAAFQQQLPPIRSLVTFFPIIKSSAAERSVDSALRASRRGATLAALVIRSTPDPVSEMIAAAPSAPTLTWTKAENDVLYDYSQALQPSERDRVSSAEQLKIGRQVCSWLEGGQSYWGVRSLFDTFYKTQVAGDYYHNRDAYIRFSTERLCPDRMASLTPPPEPTNIQIAKAPAVAPSASNTDSWNATDSTRWATEVAAPQYVPQYSGIYPVSPPIAPILPPGAPFPGRFR
ncbi:MAG: hypothetical protein MUF72_17255 [Elainella sp. Prado103]|jgi:hypothetical protein|nr:hypothetical protein [Elainella sp. Prado103]